MTVMSLQRRKLTLAQHFMVWSSEKRSTVLLKKKSAAEPTTHHQCSPESGRLHRANMDDHRPPVSPLGRDFKAWRQQKTASQREDHSGD